MNQQPSNTATARDRLGSPSVPRVSADAASLLEQQRWEREIFFQPALVEAERRSRSGSRPIGLLLAILVGLASWGSAMAQGEEFAQVADSDRSTETTFSEWLWDVFTTGEGEEPGTDTLKSGDEHDPEEGDPK